MPKWLRDLLISAQPVIIGVGAALVKATTDQEFTTATFWLIGSGLVTGGLSMYLHFLTGSAPAAIEGFTPLTMPKP